jgi:hypothetical protein
MRKDGGMDLDGAFTQTMINMRVFSEMDLSTAMVNCLFTQMVHFITANGSTISNMATGNHITQMEVHTLDIISMTCEMAVECTGIQMEIVLMEIGAMM